MKKEADIIQRLCLLVGVANLAGCCGGAPCPSGFVLSSDGRPIVGATSNCPVALSPTLVRVLPKNGSAGSCDVSATLDDGTTVSLTVSFTPFDCCGQPTFVARPDFFILRSMPVDGGSDSAQDAGLDGVAESGVD